MQDQSADTGKRADSPCHFNTGTQGIHGLYFTYQIVKQKIFIIMGRVHRVVPYTRLY